MIYWASVSVGCLVECIIQNLRIKNRSFRFYSNDESRFFYYPHVLMSAPYSMYTYKIENLRKELDIHPETKIFIDSGGFQIATGNFDINTDEKKLEILRWMEKNGNVAANIDIPPWQYSSEVGSRNFGDCLSETVYNHKLWFENRNTKSKLNLLNVLHGRNLKQFSKWYEPLKEFYFNGWAIAGSTGSIYKALVGIIFLLKKKEFENKHNKFLHIFGLSSSKDMIIITYLQRKLNKLGIDIELTFDSSSPVIITKWGDYITSISSSGLRKIHFSNKFNYKNINSMPCFCPVCSAISFEDFISFKTDGFYALASLHNLYKFMEFLNEIEFIINTDIDDLLKDYLGSNLYKVIKVIDKAFENLDVTILMKNKFIFQKVGINLFLDKPEK